MSSPDYSRARWYGASSNNYSAANRPSSDPINKIIIHVTQGSWSSAINWFKDSRAQVSAHYTIRSSDGYIGQSVHEKDIAWHAGNWNYNVTSIGIEHEGYVSDLKWFTDAMYRSSAQLSAYLCRKYRIPIDRRHIIGHNEVPGCSSGTGGGSGCHTDPGRYWDWTKYINYVKSYSSSGPYTQVVDNTTSGRFAAGSNWPSSSYSSQRYGSNYRFTNPGSNGGYARYKLKIPARDTYSVYAWWPANNGYNDRTLYMIYTVNGWVGRVVNQRGNGGRWNHLGNFAMSAGDGWRMLVANRRAGKGYIIADAVKIIRR